jgi:hypothetical protein
MFASARRVVFENVWDHGAIRAGSIAMVTMVIDSASLAYGAQLRGVWRLADGAPTSNFFLPNQ